MVELLIAVSIFSVIMGITLVGIQSYHGKASDVLAKRVALQLEARRGLVNLYRHLQEGIEVVSPAPGTTMPYLVFRDSRNNVRMVYLEEDPGKSKEEERRMFRLMTVERDPLESAPLDAKVMMESVVKLNFTTYNRGAVLVTVQLRAGKGDFSLINFVRLQNVAVEDEL